MSCFRLTELNKWILTKVFAAIRNYDLSIWTLLTSVLPALPCLACGKIYSNTWPRLFVQVLFSFHIACFQRRLHHDRNLRHSLDCTGPLNNLPYAVMTCGVLGRKHKTQLALEYTCPIQYSTGCCGIDVTHAEDTDVGHISVGELLSSASTSIFSRPCQNNPNNWLNPAHWYRLIF